MLPVLINSLPFQLDSIFSMILRSSKIFIPCLKTDVRGEFFVKINPYKRKHHFQLGRTAFYIDKTYFLHFYHMVWRLSSKCMKSLLVKRVLLKVRIEHVIVDMHDISKEDRRENT